ELARRAVWTIRDAVDVHRKGVSCHMILLVPEWNVCSLLMRDVALSASNTRSTSDSVLYRWNAKRIIPARAAALIPKARRRSTTTAGSEWCTATIGDGTSDGAVSKPNPHTASVKSCARPVV